MNVHTIRLRAPWKLRRKADRDLWHRAFGCPGNLSERETVWLVLRPAAAEVLAVLNGELLGPLDATGTPTTFDITAALRARNQLVLDVAATGRAVAENREPPVDVRLQIETNEDRR